MKKLFRFLLPILLLVIFPSKSIHAYKLVEIADINKPPASQDRRTIYITDTTTHETIINDKTNFGTYGKFGGVFLYEKLKSSKTYKNPFKIVYTNAGYYIDDNGDKQDIIVELSYDELYLYLPRDYSSKIYTYDVASFHGVDYFWTQMFAYDSDWKSIGAGDLDYYFPGQHAKISFTVLKKDGKPLDSDIANNMQIPWFIWDMDVRDYTTGISGGSYGADMTYRESVKFVSGFGDTIYVQNGNVLNIIDDNTTYRSTVGTNDEEAPLSTAVAYQITPKATIEWWGSACGTAIQFRASTYDYPYMTDPVKKANGTTNVYKVGDAVSYTISQKFPHTIDANAARRIGVKDTFDKVLDVSNVGYTVKKANEDDTKNWTLSKNGQTITLTYAPKEITASKNVVGNYSFTFTNVRVKEPDDSYQSINIRDFR